VKGLISLLVVGKQMYTTDVKADADGVTGAAGFSLSVWINNGVVTLTQKSAGSGFLMGLEIS
jgi:hypothetical protein